MPSPILPHRTPRATRVGEKVAFSRTLTEADAALFIGVTWDINPYHTGDAYVAQTRFGRRIVPGLLTASLLTHFGGLWAFLASEMSFEFLGPVYIGDTVMAESEIIEVSERGWVRLAGRVIGPDGNDVLRATIRGYPGKFEE
ncbi:MAG: enoyl-CoA hydratase [Anaerolineae bacterium]|nr:enoyl-CoA hydratase [Anaerolineae bacterium]